MLSCTRRIQFCAGHRVFGHESKCNNIHGHNYVAFFEAEQYPKRVTNPEQEGLDSIGRIVDFSVLKARLGGWIDRYWDHGMILSEEDPLVGLWRAEAMDQYRIECPPTPSDEDMKIFVMPFNPTAENMATYLLNEVAPKVLEGTIVRVTKVTLWETENCYAEARSEE